MQPDHSPSLPNGKLTIVTRAAFSGIEAEILLGGEQAPMTVMAMRVASGLGAPAHISFGEDKVFHITAGALLFIVGEERIAASAGDHLFVGRGVTHGFVASGETSARMTLVSTPARHDRFFQAMGALAPPHDPDQVRQVCRRFEQAIVGPVPSPR